MVHVHAACSKSGGCHSDVLYELEKPTTFLMKIRKVHWGVLLTIYLYIYIYAVKEASAFSLCDMEESKCGRRCV